MNAVVSALAPQGFRISDPKNVRDIDVDVLDDAGRLRVMPASYFHDTPPWLHSRAMNDSPDFVAIWKRKRASK